MANFDWQDCMPVSDDNSEVCLAKYKRLQHVYQVKSRRLRRHRQAKLDHLANADSHGSSAQQLATSPATSAAIQVDSVPAAATASVSVLDACQAAATGLKQAQQAGLADGLDCQTPHHTKLPAPGANIACELHTHQRPQTGRADTTASGQHNNTDPIMSTVSHRRPKWHDEVAHRQKVASKTYATLSLQRASYAATLEGFNHQVRPAMQGKPVRSTKLVRQENHHPNVEQLQLPKATIAHTQQHDMQNSLAMAAKHTSASQSSRQQASCPAGARQADISSSPSPSNILNQIQTKVSQHQVFKPESQSHHSSLAALPSNAAPPHRLHTTASGPVQVMHKKLTQHGEHEQLTGKAHLHFQEGSETQPDPQLDRAKGAVVLPQDSNMMLPSPVDAEEAGRDLMTNAVCSRLAPSPAQLNCTPRLLPGASDSQTIVSATLDIADCCLDMPGPILAVVAAFRHVAVCIGEPQGSMSILMLYLHLGKPPEVSGQLSAQASQLPAACELQHCMQLQQFSGIGLLSVSSLLHSNQNSSNKHGVDTWDFMDPQPKLTCHVPTPAEPYCLLANNGRLAAAGHGPWLMLWRITMDMQYTQLATMTNAQYQGVDFPDIVQLAFLGDTCQYIAGCSCMGSLAIWHSRGDLLMVHCNPMMAIQSIHQPVHTAYAAQSHAPGHFVVLAKIQQHETSEHQGKSPQPVMVALLLSHDSIFAGSAIHTKATGWTSQSEPILACQSTHLAHQLSCLQHLWDLEITAMTPMVDCKCKAHSILLGTKQGKLFFLDNARSLQPPL